MNIYSNLCSRMQHDWQAAGISNSVAWAIAMRNLFGRNHAGKTEHPIECANVQLEQCNG